MSRLRLRLSRRLRACMLAMMAVGSGAKVRAQPSPTAITDRLRTKYLRPIDFHAAIFPDTVWVGQQATYQVAVLLNAEARSRLRRNPEFLPPELRGLLAYELGTPRRVPPRSYGTDTYEAHVFQRALFAVAPGDIVVPSPQLTYSLPQSASYFSREERYTVAAESIHVFAKPLPEVNRPADFSGAIGAFRLSTKMDTVRARMGDPLVLTVRVEGIGNVKLLPRPTVEVSWASTVDGTERVQVDSSGAYIRGAKEFDFILTPTQSGSAVLPVVRYTYFDPYKGQYTTATSAPADLTIADGAIAGTTSEAAEESDLLPLRSWEHQQALTVETLPKWVSISAVGLMLLLPFAAVGDAVQRRGARRSAAGDAARLVTRAVKSTPEEQTPEAYARRVRRATLGALAPRLHVPPSELVARTDVRRVLRRRGVSRDTTRDLLTLLDDLAEAGFGRAEDRQAHSPTMDAAILDARAKELLQRVGDEAVSHGRTRLWPRRLRRTGLFALALAVGASTTPPGLRAQSNGLASTAPTSEAMNAQTRDDIVANGEAVAAYGARRFARASDRFADLVAHRPNDIDLLVNWGTAAWAANDTVAAVIAWQRAARLDPLAPDIQERLTMLPAGARAGIADVPMVPVLPLAGFAFAAWVLGWGIWIWGSRRANHAPTAADFEVPGRAFAGLLLVVAVAAAATAVWGVRALDAKSLAVVGRPETMRVGPTPDANPMGGASTGDVVRVLDVRQGWEEVEHADGRRGWMPAARLVSIENPLLDIDQSR